MNRVGTLFLALLIISSSGWAQVSSSTKSRTSTSSTENSMRIRHDDGYQSFNVEMRGKIEVTDDDKDIKSISSDGYLEITKTVFGSRRTLIITPQAGGLKREYYEGRTARPFEPEGRKWLAEILPELLRTTTIAAESRVNRFYRQGGVNAVMTEIEAMKSDYMMEHYGSLLMKVPGLAAKDYPTIVRRFSEAVDSDYYLAQFLQKGMDKFLENKDATNAVFAACRKMDSDHYQTQVIKDALRSKPISLESIKIILAASDKMDSDHYKTEVLTTLLKQPDLNDQIISEMINSTKTFESDHYRTVVLKRALDMDGLSNTSYQRVLESVKDMDSDHYKTEVLKDLLSNKLPTDQVFNLVSISNSIDSDHYLTVVFKEIFKRQDLSDDAFKSLVNRAGEVDSDHYASVILRSALDLDNLTEQKIISILGAATRIDSDHYLSEVLVEAAPMVKNGSSAMKEAYRAAAKRIDSETYYGRALRAID